jgi:hypothetical protein
MVSWISPRRATALVAGSRCRFVRSSHTQSFHGGRPAVTPLAPLTSAVSTGPTKVLWSTPADSAAKEPRRPVKSTLRKPPPVNNPGVLTTPSQTNAMSCDADRRPDTAPNNIAELDPTKARNKC